MTRTKRPAPLPVITLLILLSLCATAPAQQPRIVNGVTTFDYPAVGALLDNQGGFCTATLIGCQTALSAAHCVCGGDGSECQPGGPELIDPLGLEMFFQNAEPVAVSNIRVPADYAFGVRNDFAVIELARPVTGILPAALNTRGKPGFGSRGEIVGFGLTVNDGGGGDLGLKRRGRVVTTRCDDPRVLESVRVPDAGHLCWYFEEPLGAPGEDSNTCQGDSGGPLFFSFDGQLLLSGVTSGGISPDCQAPDYAFDADVYAARDWILAQSDDIGRRRCEALPALGSAGVRQLFTTDEAEAPGLANVHPPLDVPPFTGQLRLALNGVDNLINDFDLELLDPTGRSLCRSVDPSVYEYCELTDPEPGEYTVRVETFRRGFPASYQLTATQFQAPDASPRVFNISTNGTIDAAGMIAGFIVQGDTKRFAVMGEDMGGMRNPQLRVINFLTGEELAFNDDWLSDSAQALELEASLRAPGGSRDAGLTIDLPQGAYLATLSGRDGSGGRGLVSVTEIAGVPGARLLNISTNGAVAGEGLVAGFIVTGGPKRLVMLGEDEGGMVDPELQLVRFPEDQQLAYNDDWTDQPGAVLDEIAAKDRLPAGGFDAALIVTLQPGAYLARLRDRGGSNGRGLVSVTEVAD